MRRWVVTLLAALAAFLLVGRAVAGVYAEWTWYASMGAVALYRSKLMHEIALRGGGAIGAGLIAFVNLYVVRRSIVSLILPRRLGNLDFGEAVPGRFLNSLVVALSLIVGSVLAVPTGDWTTFALARFGQTFGERDPYLDLDIGALVYRLPFERQAHEWLTITFAVVTSLVVLLYALTPSLRWTKGRLYVSTYVRRHFAVIAATSLLLVAWGARIDGLRLTALGSGPGGQFTLYDQSVALPLFTWLSLGALAASLLVLWATWNGRVRLAALSGIAVLVAGPVLETVLPTFARTGNDRDALDRERPFRTTRMLYTRRAFGVDDIVDADSVHAMTPTPEQVVRGVATWDPAALQRSIEADLRGRASAGLSWLPARGGLAAVLLRRPATGEGPWGASGLDATTSDERGQALPWIAGWPAAANGDIAPAHVFEGASRYAVLGDSTGHVAAPSFQSLSERLVHAWHLQAPQLLAQPVPGVRPRIMFHRDVRERVSQLAPFFVVGSIILPVVRGNELYWMASLFSVSDDYPIAEPLVFAGRSRRYVRHAADAFVEASTGRVTIVADPNGDPIQRTWMRRFPWLFSTNAALNAELAELRPPGVDWAALQATALARTGIPRDSLSPKTVARADDADADLVAGPPTLFALQGDRGPLAWTIPLVDATDRVVGVILARGGDAPRTEWRRTTATLRWSAALDLLQHAADSAGIGRKVAHSRRGRVQVIPSTNGLIYAQAFYSWSPEAPPSVSGVAVIERGRTRTGATLTEALGTPRAAPSGLPTLRGRVAALYQQMGDALRRGDWNAFGAAFTALGQLLRMAPR